MNVNDFRTANQQIATIIYEKCSVLRAEYKIKRDEVIVDNGAIIIPVSDGRYMSFHYSAFIDKKTFFYSIPVYHEVSQDEYLDTLSDNLK